MSLLAIDLAQTTGWAALSTGAARPVWGRISFKKAADHPRNPDGAVLTALREWLEHMRQRYEPTWIAVERPYVPVPRPPRISAAGKFVVPSQSRPMNADTVIRLAAMYGTVAEFSHRFQIGFRATETWTVEKHFLGSGKHKSAEKKRLTKQMCELQGWKPVTLDEADALALLSWMAASLGVRLSGAGPLFKPLQQPIREPPQRRVASV